MEMRLPASRGYLGDYRIAPKARNEPDPECGKDLPAARKVEVFFAPSSRRHHAGRTRGFCRATRPRAPDCVEAGQECQWVAGAM